MEIYGKGTKKKSEEQKITIIRTDVIKAPMIFRANLDRIRIKWRFIPQGDQKGEQTRKEECGKRK